MYGMDDFPGYPKDIKIPCQKCEEWKKKANEEYQRGFTYGSNLRSESSVNEEYERGFRDGSNLRSESSVNKKQLGFHELGLSFIGVLFANGAQNIFSQFSEDGKKFSIFMLTFSGYLGSIYSTAVITENPGKMSMACLIGTPVAIVMQKILMSACNLK